MGRRLRLPFVLDAAVVRDEADMARLTGIASTPQPFDRDAVMIRAQYVAGAHPE